MAAILRDPVVAVVFVCTRPRAIRLAMRKSFMALFFFPIWVWGSCAIRKQTQLFDEVEQNIVICQWQAGQLFAEAEV